MSVPAASSAARRLLQAVRCTAPAGPAWQRLAMVGICKNAGKTVALNQLVAAAVATGLPLALASTGRDGEDRDAITDLPKPQIWVPEGAWLATVTGALALGSARLDVAAEMDIVTPLGCMVIARVRQAGTVLLVGPGARQRLGLVLDDLERRAGTAAPSGHLAPGLLIVDGSFDRSAAAAPAITGTVVVAVGAAYSPDIERLVLRARHVTDVLGLPPVPTGWQDAARRALANYPAAVVRGDAVQPLPVSSSLSEPAAVLHGLEAAIAAAGADGEAAYDPNAAGAVWGLAVAGAVSDGLLAVLGRKPALLRQTSLLVPDATHVVCDPSAWHRFRHLGGSASALRTVRVAGVACNPHAPMGPGYDPASLLVKLRAALPGVTVVDVEFEL